MTTTAHKVATLRGFKHKQQDTSGCNTSLTHKEAAFDCCLLQELTSGNVTQFVQLPLTASWPRRHGQTPVFVNKVKMNRAAVQVGLDVLHTLINHVYFFVVWNLIKQADQLIALLDKRLVMLHLFTLIQTPVVRSFLLIKLKQTNHWKTCKNFISAQTVRTNQHVLLPGNILHYYKVSLKGLNWFLFSADKRF